MPISDKLIGQRAEHTPFKTRVASRENGDPPSKRARLDQLNDSSPVKGPLKQSAEENVSSFVAKSFYGLKKTQTRMLESSKKSSKKPLGMSVTLTTYMTENKILSQLDKMMLEKIAMSPVKQAVLQTCTLAEFRKMYRDEYTELENEVKKDNCRVTRQASKAVTKNKEREYSSSDSSDDEIGFRVNDKGFDCIKRDQSGPRKVTEKISSNNHINKNTTPKKNNLQTTSMSKKNKVKEHVIAHETEEAETEFSESNVTLVRPFPEKGSNEPNTNHQEPSQENHLENDSNKKCKTTPKSEKKFFKTRSPLDDCKKGKIIFGRGFNLKFTLKTKKQKGDKKKNALQKKQAALKSPKMAQKSTAPNSSISYESAQSGNKLAEEQALSPLSGFTFAPGFLSPEKSVLDIQEEDDDNLDFKKNSGRTYGSALHDTAGTENNIERDSSYESSSYSPPANASIPSRSSQANCSSKKDAPEHLTSDKTVAPQVNDSGQSIPKNKLFPIFQGRHGRLITSNKKQSDDASPASSSIRFPKDSNNSQMIIDAGQKTLGATHCAVCGMIYCHSDPSDEADHAKFHKRLVEVLKFPGWKKERVVQEYPEDLGRVILVMPDDPKYAKKKVEEVNQLMGRELGFPDISSSPLHPHHKVFFYVEDKQITGCCVAEPVQEGFCIIPGDLDNSQESGQRPWCCAPVSEPVCVGIGRLWVAASKRKHGVATKLVDCVRQWFNYGTLVPKHKIAFSDPTPDGCRFAQKYMGSPTFLVYKFHYG